MVCMGYTCGIDTDTAQEHNGKDQPLLCSVCNSFLGIRDSSLVGFMLYKSSMALKKDRDDVWQQYPELAFVTAQLLSMMESDGSRKYLVVCSGDTEDSGGELQVH